MSEQQKPQPEYSEVDWGNIPSASNRGNGAPRVPDPNKIPFMKFESGPGGSPRVYHTRFVGKSIQFWSHYIENFNGRKYTVRVLPKYKKAAEEVLSKFFEQPIQMRWRCASFAFNRDENNALRLIENGSQMFEPISFWATSNPKPDGSPTSPGDNAGVNWAIKVTGSGNGKTDGSKNPRKYLSSGQNPAPFTKDETALIKANLDKMKFSTYFKMLTPEEIVPFLTGANREPVQASAPAGAAPTDEAGELFNASQW